MTDLSTAAANYLRTRRALGYKLTQQGQQLIDFVSYLQAAGEDRITVERAVAWAEQPTGASPAWWAARLGVVRGFALYMQALDPATDVPPAGLVPACTHRTIPYIYTDDDIHRLLEAAGRLRPPVRADTYRTLIALLAVTGLRVGEAIGLDRVDLDWEQGLLTVRLSKFNKSRQLPLHPSTIEALRGYAHRRGERRPTPTTRSFFVSTVGTRLIRDNTGTVFARLVRNAGLTWSGRRRPPRLHDLRHSFAVRILLGWYRTGVEVEPRLPLLSTWLGHTGPASTYWYLTAVPELLSLAADRLEEHPVGRP